MPLERWLEGDKPHAICHTPSTIPLRVCDGCFDHLLPPPKALPTVEIPDAIHEPAAGLTSKAHTHYILRCTAADGSQYGISRRYTTFEEVCAQLLPGSEAAAVAFPPKESWFGSKTVESLIEERRAGLTAWLSGVVGTVAGVRQRKEPARRQLDRTLRQFLAPDDSIETLGTTHAATARRALGPLKSAPAARSSGGGIAAAMMDADSGGAAGSGAAGGGGGLLSQLESTVGGNLEAVKAMQSEVSRQNKQLDRAAKANQRGASGVGDMQDRLHAQGFQKPTEKEVRAYTATRTRNA